MDGRARNSVMSINKVAIIEAFEKYKLEGLTYYEATQKLQQAGYSKQEIISVAYFYKYTDNLSADHPETISSDIDAKFTEAASTQHSLNRLQEKKDQHMIRSNYPVGGSFWSIMSVMSWARYTSAERGIPKSKIYLAYALAVIGFHALVFASIYVLIATHLPKYLMVIAIIMSFMLAQYCLARYLK